MQIQSRRYSPDERRHPIATCASLRIPSGLSQLVDTAPESCFGVFFMNRKSDNNPKLDEERARRKQIRRNQAALVIITIPIFVIIWQLVVLLGDFPAFILPPPRLVWSRFVMVVLDGSLFRHFLVTLGEVLAGLSIGALASTILGYILAKSKKVERLLSPYLIASQSIPVVAIAPLLVIWFGPGIQSKILICALTVFFPILVNTIVGLRTVSDDLRDMMRSLQATRWQTLVFLEIPAALPVFLGGLKVGATLSVIGAVVGEFVGADRGLGFMINRARGQYDTALVFVALLTLITMAISLYGVVALAEAKWLSWRERPE